MPAGMPDRWPAMTPGSRRRPIGDPAVTQSRPSSRAATLWWAPGPFNSGRVAPANPPESKAAAPLAVPLAGQELNDFRSGERSVEPTRPFARFSGTALPDQGSAAGQTDAASVSPVDQLRDLCSLRDLERDPSPSDERSVGADAQDHDDIIEPCRPFARISSSPEEQVSVASTESGAGGERPQPNHSIPDAPAPASEHAQDSDSTAPAGEEVEPARSRD